MVKVRKYPERVTASMYRVYHDNEALLLRHNTSIHFGESTKRLGMVIMTNPGSFELKKTPEWISYKNGTSEGDTFEVNDYADLTMRNIIKLLKCSFEGHSEPSGILRVYNLSNVRQSSGPKAEVYHNRAKQVISNHVLSLLEDPITHSQDSFLEECDKSRFIIMGFVDKVFEEKMSRVIDWSEHVRERRVCAVDNKGRFSHPRRWITEPLLMEKAVESLKSVIQV
ncbi:hypothetical protein P5G61_22705 [Paenibacillus sp. F6_3S_P_1C]|uniref:Uncharacterized protein n=1 Tax=Paenibacillus vandeheii TaxID=3035917 RepID=A0ABT8JGK6_9BACL|nr:hypothetical protein [Paenibacillus vandeheii]MDN4604072.1 hypothetical protein [Paenibacillus vandeheii]